MTHVLLIGCGNMGYALLQGWMALDPAPAIMVVEPQEALRDRTMVIGIPAVAAVEALPNHAEPDIIVLAVKPQVMKTVLPRYVRWGGGETIFISVAAGLTIADLEAILPANTPVLRCMPNTPAAIGAGVMATCANGHMTPEQIVMAHELLAAGGPVFDIPDEGLMDAVTAVSGSGPAYVFHFIEAMTAAALAVGLPESLAQPIAMQTIEGAARVAALGYQSAETLRRKITSPGGTTAAALDVLMCDTALVELIQMAVTAARDRSIELRNVA